MTIGILVYRGNRGRSRLWPRWLASRGIHSTAGLGALPTLTPGERLLRHEVDGGGRPVVATDRGFYHSVDEGWSRLGWEQVRRVDWDGQRRTLLLRALTDRSTSVVLRRGSTLVALARERVAWCILPVGPTRLDGVGTLLAVRRQPGADRLVWVVAFDADVERDDPVTLARLASALRRVRARVGL